MSHLIVFHPRLFGELAPASGLAPDLSRRPALRTLLNRAAIRELGQPTYEQSLFAEFGLAAGGGAVPAAALTATLDGIEPARRMSMRADPVHLRADPNQILLFSDPAFAPSEAEADALLEVLNSGFDDIAFCRGQAPGRWYCNFVALANTSSPAAANGRSIAGYLPSGADAEALKQIMNDAQMLLHEHPVNVARENRGLPPINSIWPWGGGTLEGTPAGPAFVRGDDVLAAALAARGGIDWDARAEASEVIDRCRATAAGGLVVIGAPGGGVAGAVETVSPDDFERNWCQPLLHALGRCVLKQLILVTDRHAYRLSPLARYSFWRTSGFERHWS